MNIQTLMAGLTAEDETDRINAAEDLGYANGPEAITPLIERLAVEPVRKVRETLFLALGRIDHPEVIDRMVMLLESDDAFVRNQAVGVLQRKGAPAAIVLLSRMRAGDADVRKFVLDAAAGISSPEVDAIYDAAMQDADANVRIAALEYIGEQRMTRFKPAAESVFLQATEPMLICAAFAALLQIGDAASWQCIRRRYPAAASVPNWELGWWVRGLGEFGGATEFGVFQDLLQLHDGKVAGDVIDALERFQSRHGRMEISDAFWNLLRELLRETVAPEDRLQLLRVVGGFGPAGAIGDYLVTLLDHSDRLTKLGAIEGIRRLGRPELLALLHIRRESEKDPVVAEALGSGGAS